MKEAILGLLALITLSASGQREAHFFLKPSIAFTGVARDLERRMKNDGFDDTSPSTFFSGPRKHPFTRRVAGLGISAELEIPQRKERSYSIAGGITDWGEVLGYDAIGEGNELSLWYYNFVLTPSFNYRRGNNVFAAGPTLAAFHYWAYRSESPSRTAWILGGSLSASHFLKRKTRLEKGFFLQANLFPGTRTKAIIKRHQVTDFGPAYPIVYTSTLQPARINTSNLLLGAIIKL